MYKKGTLKVTWIGADPNFLFSKMFTDLKAAEDFADAKEDVMIMELHSVKDDDYAWKLIPFGNSNDFVRGVKMRRFLRKSLTLSGTDGIAEIKPATVEEYQKSQTIRLVNVFVIAPILLYSATFKSLPMWLRIALGVIGGATFY